MPKAMKCQIEGCLHFAIKTNSEGIPVCTSHALGEPLISPKPAEIGRNDPCPCGSGKKFKKCHGSPIHSPGTPLPSPVSSLSTKKRKSSVGTLPAESNGQRTTGETSTTESPLPSFA